MRHLVILSSVVVLATIAALLVGAADAPPADARTAIARSLDFLEREGFAWMDGRVSIQDGKGCVSCHHVGFAVWSLREAQRQGIERPDTELDLLENRAVTFLGEAGCRAASCAPLLLASNHAREGPDLVAVSRLLLGEQADDHWRARGQFPTQRRPIEESDAVATMWTILALDSFGAPDAERDSRAAAGHWIHAGGSGGTTEWHLVRLLVEHGTGDRVAVNAFRHELLERQNKDGGWAWRPGQASNAMTTGQAVYALALTDDPGMSHASLKRGVAWLLSTQGADGTWVTASELVSTEPSPGKNYVYNYWGTAWASIGLSRAIDALADLD